MSIEPTSHVSSYKQGTIVRTTRDEIIAKLGQPTDRDVDGKCAYEWTYLVDGVPISIWDWKGSGYSREWSYFGPVHTIAALFGEENVIPY